MRLSLANLGTIHAFEHVDPRKSQKNFWPKLETGQLQNTIPDLYR